MLSFSIKSGDNFSSILIGKATFLQQKWVFSFHMA